MFATVTAPLVRRVHGRREGARRCHPASRGPLLCPHGRPRTCQASHAEDDALLGQPLCGECYDYASHVVWQWWAPDLWRRFTIALRRLVAKTLDVPASRLGDLATVQYAKVAEYQLRGVVHFHALVRLDGPKTPEGFATAPTAVDAQVLADLVRQAVTSVRLTVPGVDDHDPARILAFGGQLDARPVKTGRRTDDPAQGLTPEQVAGYLAKYATKSRRYSITLDALRRARRRAQSLIAEHKAAGRPLDLAALEADLLAEGERILAIAAAARAREYDQWKAEQRNQKRRNSGAGTVG